LRQSRIEEKIQVDLIIDLRREWAQALKSAPPFGNLALRLAAIQKLRPGCRVLFSVSLGHAFVYFGRQLSRSP
jgi:hypothetical protein